MPTDPLDTLILAGAALLGLAIAAAALLSGWRGWLALRRFELEQRRDSAAPPSPAARIELADLKERLRKLEAIAAGVDL
ncbi:hypothetical protein [Sphingomonas jatrophae]|uniref:Uncharacterized protein n=1 Tax=Sphingomonas jatrophae TaxID=1166337 RepID=A0A1I6JYZ0_9SPHN|nr:hypothetical protein [Sphingomonas jatrophae]SFR84108.1 hypothetical protein SAMN05192580_1094 [Sphingomonas jatrophae]